MSWSFRYGGTHRRCMAHPPKRSELTQSLMSGVYAAIEDAETMLPEAINIDDLRSIQEQVADAGREVVDQYREAAENFGGAGENAERADELEGWVEEVECIDFDEPEQEEFDEGEHEEEAKERSDAEDISYSMAMQMIRDEWEAENDYEQAMEEAVEAGRESLTDAINNLSL